MASVEDLYKVYDVMVAAKDKISEHETEYKAILSSVKGNANEKRLASQFIARFCKHFPQLMDQSLDCMFDLCDDDDVSIRKQVIKDLSSLCKNNQEHLTRISDVLTQLLHTEDHTELSLIYMSLTALLRINAKGTLNGLFAQILQGEEAIRSQAISFLNAKMKIICDEVLAKEVEEYLVEQSKKVLEDVTGEEFLIFIRILTMLPSMTTLQGRQQLVDIITEQAALGQPFDPKDQDCIDRLIQCTKQALPLFSKNVHSTLFFEHFCSEVLPVLPSIEDDSETKGTSSIQLDIIKMLAECAGYATAIKALDKCVDSVFVRLLDYMPLPPSEDEKTDKADDPQLQFSHVECLMYVFHLLAQKLPEYLTAPENAERLKDFRLRLQYFARGVQQYIRQLRMFITSYTSPPDLTEEEMNIRQIALKATKNIDLLIKDLFHNPPAYKVSIVLSYKSGAPQKFTKADESPTQKRQNIKPITFDSDAPPSKKNERELYSPPGGKFSNKAGSFPGYRGRGRRVSGGQNWRGGRGRVQRW